MRSHLLSIHSNIFLGLVDYLWRRNCGNLNIRYFVMIIYQPWERYTPRVFLKSFSYSLKMKRPSRITFSRLKHISMEKIHWAYLYLSFMIFKTLERGKQVGRNFMSIYICIWEPSIMFPLNIEPICMYVLQSDYTFLISHCTPLIGYSSNHPCRVFWSSLHYIEYFVLVNDAYSSHLSFHYAQGK